MRPLLTKSSAVSLPSTPIFPYTCWSRAASLLSLWPIVFKSLSKYCDISGIWSIPSVTESFTKSFYDLVIEVGSNSSWRRFWVSSGSSGRRDFYTASNLDDYSRLMLFSFLPFSLLFLGAFNRRTRIKALDVYVPFLVSSFAALLPSTSTCAGTHWRATLMFCPGLIQFKHSNTIFEYCRPW